MKRSHLVTKHDGLYSNTFANCFTIMIDCIVLNVIKISTFHAMYYKISHTCLTSHTRFHNKEEALSGTQIWAKTSARFGKSAGQCGNGLTVP